MNASKVRRTKEFKLSKAVYCLAPMHDNIVDAVLKIMDEDGPKPMRNMRPSRKQRTGGERFEIEHHGEYEARVQPSESKVTRVVTHNMAYPKMYDELEKKRSTARTTAFTENHKQLPDYCACKQSRNKSQKNTNRRNKYRRNTKPQRGTPGISKPKQKIRKRNRSAANFTFSKIRTHKGCQCSCQHVKLVEKCVSTYDDYGSVHCFKMAGINFDRQGDQKQELETSRQKSLRFSSVVIKNEPKSDLESQHQETSLPSVTSYNSYLSMDHEPMIE